ncbi:fibronectin type III domain-containing protein 5b-like [Tachypleus tridentatus]|uniref:fibronectin type III domain-containing protein 5b-like n=1 Tax=Tachypleus tridentatus TaxID=6853 RepID=UPI003FD64023
MEIIKLKTTYVLGICLLLSLQYGETTYLPVPYNISLVLTKWSPPEVRVFWIYDSKNESSLIHFDVTYRPQNARYRIVQEVSPKECSVVLNHLLPGIPYHLHLTPISEIGSGNHSEVIHFISPKVQDVAKEKNQSLEKARATPEVREEEIVIVVLVLAVWVAVILVFFNKWGKIRMLEPYQPDYRSPLYKSTRVSLVEPILEELPRESRVALSGQPRQNSIIMSSTYSRLRQNSVFIGSTYNRTTMMAESGVPRKVKSAEDIKSLVIQIGHHRQNTAI